MYTNNPNIVLSKRCFVAIPVTLYNIIQRGISKP